jgi:hypothetical protein
MLVFAAVQVAPGLRIRPRKLAITWAKRTMQTGRLAATAGWSATSGAFYMRKRSHEPCRFRMVGACPDTAFRSAQPLHSCARDTDQLVELALFGIPDAAAQKVRPSSHRIALCCLLSSRYQANHAMRSRLRLRMASAYTSSGLSGYNLLIRCTKSFPSDSDASGHQLAA